MTDRTRSALMVIGATTVLTLVVYGLIRWIWVLPIAETSGKDEAIGWANVLIVTLLAGFAAWGVYTLLRRSGRERWWPIVGSTALAISIIGPSYMADGSSAVALIVLHVVTAIPLILGFARIDSLTGGVPAVR